MHGINTGKHVVVRSAVYVNFVIFMFAVHFLLVRVCVLIVLLSDF